MVDSLDLLEVPAVPITLFIDEQGIIRAVGPRPDELPAFLRTDFGSSTPESSAASGSEKSTKAEKWHDEAVDLFLTGGDPRVNQAIEKFEKVLEADISIELK